MVEFMKIQIWMHQIYRLKSNNCRKTRMLWHGRPNDCGSWLPKGKKNNLWHGRKLWLTARGGLSVERRDVPPPGNGGGTSLSLGKQTIKKEFEMWKFFAREGYKISSHFACKKIIYSPPPSPKKGEKYTPFLPPLALLVPTITNIIKNRSTLARKHSPS